MIKMLLPVVLVASLAASSAEDPPESTIVEVVLADFSFAPSTLNFQQGGHYRLRLSNQGSGGHNFSAQEFFAAVEIDTADQPLVKKGKIEVPKGGTAEIGFTAIQPGNYRIKCTHFLHGAFGMKGRAIIN